MKKNLFAICTVIALFISQVVQAQNGSPYWSLAGNSNTSATSKFGTTNGVSLRFYTNNLQRMIIGYNTGNVGIGTTSPSRKLHVVGTSLFTANLNVSNGGITATNTAGYGVSATGSDYYAGIYGYGSSPYSIGVFGQSSNYIGVSGSGGTYGIYGTGTGPASRGVYGSGDTYGVYAQATGTGGYTYGVYGTGHTYGIAGESDIIGVYGYSYDGYGIYGSTNTSTSFAGYFEGDVYSNGNYLGSDRILKQNIADVTSAMDLIKKLQPKSYNFRQDGNYKLMNLPTGKHYGLIAQDVEQVLPSLVKATKFETGRKAHAIKQEPEASLLKSSDVLPSETIAFKALNYTEFIPIVIKGMQELDAENKDLKKEVAELRQMVLDLKNDKTESNTSTGKSVLLEQNTPNPVAGNTTIRYYIPITAASAKLIITDAKGQILKTHVISNKGEGHINFNSAPFTTGTYNYSLWIQGKLVDTKSLVIAR